MLLGMKENDIQLRDSFCTRCLTGGRYLRTDYCEHCYRELTNQPPTFVKLKQHIMTSIIHRILIDNSISDVFINRSLFINGKKICPDIRFSYLKYQVIIEIDEHCHRNYDEHDRDQLLNKIPNLILIRINADGYDCFYPIVEKKSKLENGLRRDDIKIYEGEIERREKIIKNCLENLFILLHSTSTSPIFLFYE
jgi:very-short-patch-repair endonuclease